MAAALEALGGLDILVNNVGSGAVRTFDDLTDADWQRTFDLNFMSYVRVTRACLPHLRRSVNAVAPGPIWTPFWTKPGGFADTFATHHQMEPMAAVEHEMTLRQLPLRRLGTPEEVARVVVFLASSAGSFVTGSVWGVDGGSIRGLI